MTTKLHPLVERLLSNRGIKEEGDIEKFLNPNYDEDLHDPFLLKDMNKAVDRILSAIKKEEKIIIYTDYDMDGIPSAVILYDFFIKIGYKNFENYIPHRHKEGYGLNKEAIKKFGKDKVTLMITADCGITDNEEVEFAQSLGIDVILTDHHLVGEVLPPAFAVINPKRKDDEYPFPMLCGCGVIFKLITALLIKGKEEKLFDVSLGWEKWLLDMVGMATIADMVPLVGENRVLASYGLRVLRKSPRQGLVSLFRKARILQRNICEEDVGFVIGPRINSASRIDVPMRAFELLSASDSTEAMTLATHLEKLNNRRKGLVASAVKDARKRLAERDLREVIVIGNPDWLPGILGLVANNLAEEHSKPAFVWGRGESGDTIKGSCRSGGDINIVECMSNAPEGTFIGFGGHSASGGFSVSNESIHTLEDSLVEGYKKSKKKEGKEKDENNTRESLNDGELSLSEVNWATYNLYREVAPFGVGNPKPAFIFSNNEIFGVRWFGKDDSHIELTLKDEKGRSIFAIAFFVKGNESFISIERGSKVSLRGSLDKNFFMGKRDVRLSIVEILTVL